MEFLLALIASPLLAALVAVGGVIATIRYTNRREHDRQGHERQMKDKELAAERQSRLRDERIAATTTAHTDRKAVAALAAAQAEISLLAGSPELSRAAEKVWVRYGAAQRTADKTKKDPANTPASVFAQALDKARISREEFLELAREELGVDPDSAP